MASVEKRERDGKVTWLARWRDDTGRQRKRSFTRKIDAQRFVIPDRGRHAARPVRRPVRPTTVLDYARRWAAARIHRPTTARRVREHDRHPHRRDDSGLTAAGCRHAVRGAGVGVRPRTGAGADDPAQPGEPAAIGLRLGGAGPAGRLAHPWSGCRCRPPIGSAWCRCPSARFSRWPTPCRRATARWSSPRPGCGLRIGELLSLRVQDVDFMRRTVRIEWQLAPASKVRSAPKTRRSTRTVPLPQVVAEALSVHIAEFPPGRGRDAVHDPLRHALPPRLLRHADLRRRRSAKAGLRPQTTSHDLRHHYASVLLAQGESVVAVAERLGHHNASLVLSTYGHLMPDSEDRTRRAVDSAWSACAPSVPHEGGAGR